jgi:hypothetical protein
MRYPFFMPIAGVSWSLEDGCGGATFSIGNLQFIRNLYKITYNIGVNYKLFYCKSGEIWKIWPEVCNLLIINRLR